MLELGRYAGAVISSWAASLALVALVVVITVIQSRRVKARLEAVETARKDK